MKIEVRAAEDRDLERIKYLIDQCISRDFYTIEELEDMLKREDDLLYVAVDADRNGWVMAYFYAFLSTLDEALRILHVRVKPEALQKCTGNERVGVYKTSSTDPAYRNRGVFSSFMVNLQPVLRAKGAKMILNTALRPLGKEIPILNILRDTGFTPVMTVRRPWAGKKGYCPYCEQEYCVCDGVLYIKKLKETEDENIRG